VGALLVVDLSYEHMLVARWVFAAQPSLFSPAAIWDVQQVSFAKICELFGRHCDNNSSIMDPKGAFLLNSSFVTTNANECRLLGPISRNRVSFRRLHYMIYLLSFPSWLFEIDLNF
jgi:hypothetical protein